jgi:tellurite resistance protein
MVLAPIALLAARMMWPVGAAGTVFFEWLIVSRWMTDRQQLAYATSAWIVSVV